MFKEDVTQSCSHPNGNTSGICNNCLGRANDVIGHNISGAASRRLTPAEQIRIYWDELKERDRMFRDGKTEDRYWELIEKYQEIETLFGHESNLQKAQIYYLNTIK